MDKIDILIKLGRMEPDQAQKLLTQHNQDLSSALRSLAEHDENWYELANRRIWALVEDYAQNS